MPKPRLHLPGLLGGALVVSAVCIAYHNSLEGPFVFDDQPAIVGNPTLRDPLFSSAVLSPPADGSPVSGRPLLNFSFALNYTWTGLAPWSYHVVNTAIHALGALLLLGIVRRTLLQPNIKERFGSAALPLATATAVLWAVHPLQTAAVTYTSQRAESLAGLLYLLTLYAFIRSTDSPRRVNLWSTLSVASCLLGVAAKETVATAPLLIVLYDRTFVSGSFASAWRRHWPQHLAHACSWLLLGWLLGGTAGRANTAGFGLEVSSWNYALTQTRALIHYVRLAVWPEPLIFDYGRTVVDAASEVWAQGLAIIALLTGVVWATVKKPPLGFLGCWFFLILAPTSSIVPIADPIFEHRLYLSLAAPLTIVVVASWMLAGRRSLFIMAAVTLVFSALTLRRNEHYHSEIELWQDTAQKRPENPRAWNGLGRAYMKTGEPAAAIASFETAIRLDSSHVEALNNLGVLRFQSGDYASAISLYQRAITIDPSYAEAHGNLANALSMLGRETDADRHYAEAIRLYPAYVDAFYNWGAALARRGLLPEALASFEAAARLNPDDPQLQANLARLREILGQPR